MKERDPIDSATVHASEGSNLAVPLVAHVIFRLDVGGLENGLVNLINHIPPNRYRHAVVCLKDQTGFCARIRRDDVRVFTLNKRPGTDMGLYVRLWRLFRSLKPDVVHTRNLSTMEALVPARFAGVPHCVHGEHGWDVHDLYGRKLRYQILRRALSPLVDRFVVVSRGLETYLKHQVRVPPDRVTRIINGVDTELFRPPSVGREPMPVQDFVESDAFVIATVGRMEVVKDPVTLARAFVRLVELLPHVRSRLRLVMVGNGSQRQRVEAVLKCGGVESMAWLPGQREDVPSLMRGINLFVLPSLAEGISNTILESMASGLPVVATGVGGNRELVEDGVTGTLVPPKDPEAMAEAIAAYVVSPEMLRLRARAARERVVREFSITRMVDSYVKVYDSVLSDWKGTVAA